MHQKSHRNRIVNNNHLHQLRHLGIQNDKKQNVNNNNINNITNRVNQVIPMMMMASRLPVASNQIQKIKKKGNFSTRRQHHFNKPKIHSLRSKNNIMLFNNKNRKNEKRTRTASTLKRTRLGNSRNNNNSGITGSRISTSSKDIKRGLSSSLQSLPLTEIITKAIAFTIPVSVLLTLAMNNDPTDLLLSSSSSAATSTDRLSEAATREMDFVLYELEEGIEKLESLTSNILDAALPQDATDLFSIALGESIAGLLGALATWGLNMSLMMSGKKMMKNKNDFGEGSISSSNKNSNSVSGEERRKIPLNSSDASFGKSSDQTEMDNIITEAVADGDYFLTRATATPLIGAVGLSGGMASALTVLLASVPYELIKFNARVKEQRRKREDMYMEALLQKEIKRKRQWFGLGGWMMNNENKKSLNGKDQSVAMVDVDIAMKDDKKGIGMEGEGNAMEMKYQFDSIELFADVCKWLEYDVLMTDFGGQLQWLSTGIPINAGLESAAFGGLAALSSQIYADVIYRFSDSMGTSTKRDEVRSRTLKEFFNLYSVKVISAATLFGVYESARLPITQIISNFLSGGIESCVGSADYDLCLETYFFSNPAEATPEAELRSFVVAVMNVFENLVGDVSNENVDAAALIRSISVQLYSIIGFDLTSSM